jgi:hypothetical protein
VTVEVQGSGGRKRGIRGGIVHVDGKEGDVGKGGGEKEGCDVTIADMLNGNFFDFVARGTVAVKTYSTSLKMSVSTIRCVVQSACAPNV